MGGSADQGSVEEETKSTQVLKRPLASVTKMLGGIRDKLSPSGKKAKLKGSAVVLSRKVLDATDLHAIVVDNIYEILGNSITCQLISAMVTDPNNGGRGIVGSEANLQQWLGLRNLPSLACRGECKFKVKFDWEVEKHGVPGAIIVKNKHSTKFFLKTITLDNVPGRGTVLFVANSWVHPAGKYHGNRVFFANDPYLPSQMPEGLRPYRDDELRCLRGDDKQGPYQAHDRVYRYAVYNDLGEPDRDSGSARAVLGGSEEHPYPRRGRTGRVPSRKDPRSESRLSLLEEVYVPSDERFAHLKMADFAGYSLKAIVQGVLPAIRTYVDLSPGEFDSFKDMMNLYKGTLKLPNIPALNDLRNSFPIQLVRELLPVGGNYFLKLLKPDIIKENESGWRTDEEFAREILAGVNPVVITRLTEFPPKSSLDPSKYGDHTSTITAQHIEKSLEGLSVQQALDGNRLYILDHHDHFMPFLIDINNLAGVHAYATRTLLFLRGDDTLKPVAIELSLPLIKGNLIDATSKVYTPASSGTEYWVWQLAKAYVAVNDSCWHQLISHWLNTHAVMEPFVIATNRQLSAVHPVYKLLHPHYRDTMTINALARQTLVNAGGIFEQVVCFTGKHSLPISSMVYKDWKFTEQGLPDDLIKRGVAVEDPSSPCKVRLLLKDYPYATDGLAIWQAIEEWVMDYCAIYYKDDQAVQGDEELRAWWKEVREVGHGDLKDTDWWPDMQTVAELTKACTTIVWIASALHAAVNFGQYSYAGYIPNRPTVSRRPMPEPGSEEYAELERKPERFFIRTITSQFQTILGVSLLEILSKHSSDEIYLGQRETPAWTSDAEALQAFKRFGEKLVQIERVVESRNSDPLLKNRIGPANLPYTLLYPNTSDDEGKATGITAKGIPNSISI